MRQRPGVMAPPDLYDRPAKPGLMSPSSAGAEPVDPKIFLWAVAFVLAAVELCFELAVS
jgi:hypothetical protein